MSRCIPLARDLSDKSENKFSKIIPHLMPTILCTIATAYPQSKSMEFCHAWCMHVLHNFWGVDINTTAFCLGQYSLHLLLLKSSMTKPIKMVP